jgi:mRNA interferase MazF
MEIKQGDVYWVQVADESDISHPHVVIELDTATMTVCAVTTNARKISIPGNILLEIGEANLLKQSIVEVSKVAIIDKIVLGSYIGTLSEQRVQQILAGRRFVQRSFFNR